MSTLTVTIKAGNAAFEPEPGVELARILRKLAQALEFAMVVEGALLSLYDIDGITVGQARWKGGK